MHSIRLTGHFGATHVPRDDADCDGWCSGAPAAPSVLRPIPCLRRHGRDGDSGRCHDRDIGHVEGTISIHVAGHAIAIPVGRAEVEATVVAVIGDTHGRNGCTQNCLADRDQRAAPGVLAQKWWFLSAAADIALQQGHDRLVIRVLAVAHVRVHGWIGPGVAHGVQCRTTNE